MVNYSLGKIYKITGGGLTYIGSTCYPLLCQRFAQHQAGYRQWLKTKKRYLSSYDVLDADNECSITLIETYPCSSKDELRMRESHFIDTLECVNRNQAYRSPEDRARLNKLNDASRYRENIEGIREYNKEYRAANQDKISAYRVEHKAESKESKRKYYIANKEKLQEKGNEFRAANPEYGALYWATHKDENNKKRNENPRPICECGSSFRADGLKRHLVSKKHLDFIAKSQGVESGYVPCVPCLSSKKHEILLARCSEVREDVAAYLKDYYARNGSTNKLNQETTTH